MSKTTTLTDHEMLIAATLAAGLITPATEIAHTIELLRSVMYELAKAGGSVGLREWVVQARHINALHDEKTQAR